MLLFVSCAVLRHGASHWHHQPRVLHFCIIEDTVRALLENISKAAPIHSQSTKTIQHQTIATHPLNIPDTTTGTTLPKIDGVISVTEFQQAFKAVKERMSSCPSVLHYSMWKVVTLEDDLVEWLSIMMNLRFMYGFFSKQWAITIDVMIEKKKDVSKIHQL